MDCTAASDKAKAAGVDAVNCTAGNPAPTAGDINKVYSISPTGRIEPSQLLTLTYYTDQTPLDTPTAPTLPAQVTAGGTAQVGWTGYTCPSGTGAVSSYNLTAINGTFSINGQSTAAFGPNDRSASIEVANTTGTLTVKYTVTCTGAGGNRATGDSPEANAQIGPATTPSSTP